MVSLDRRSAGNSVWFPYPVGELQNAGNPGWMMSSDLKQTSLIPKPGKGFWKNLKFREFLTST
jgi:hypothetical protein